MRRILQFFLIVMSALIGFLFAGAAWANPQAGSAVTQEQVKGNAGAASAPSYSASAATSAESATAPLAEATTATSAENAVASKQQSGGPMAAPAAVVAVPGASKPAANAASIGDCGERSAQFSGITSGGRERGRGLPELFFGVRADAPADEMDRTKQEETFSERVSRPGSAAREFRDYFHA